MEQTTWLSLGKSNNSEVVINPEHICTISEFQNLLGPGIKITMFNGSSFLLENTTMSQMREHLAVAGIQTHQIPFKLG